MFAGYPVYLRGLEAKTGIHVSALSRFFAGKRPLNAFQVQTLAHALQLTTDEFVALWDERVRVRHGII
jgi:hypothetical protein